MRPNSALNKSQILTLFLLGVFCSFSQDSFFGEGPVNWETRKVYEIPAEAEKYASSDLVILDDLVEVFFRSETKEKLVRTIKYKINTFKGLEIVKHIRMPESFDEGFDKYFDKQGRSSRIKTPNLGEYNVKVFAARKYSRQRWSNVKVKDNYEALKRIKPTGEFAEENNIVFNLGNIAVGDVIEIYYELYFDTRYGSNIFYFNGAYPKLKCEYDFIFRAAKTFTEATYALPINIDQSNIYSSRVDYQDYFLITKKIQLSDLQANNYTLNSSVAEKLPHICFDFNYYRGMVNYTDKRFSFTRSVKPKNYEWLIPVDTNCKTQTNTLYDKHSLALRKFLINHSRAVNDSQSVVFLKSLCDTFNTFRYISPNQLYYNESHLHDMSSGDHLLKRRLVGQSLWKLYTDLFQENNMFYYLVNIQDKRFGTHQLKQRAHFAYEHNLIAVPIKDSFVYLMPRYNGLKYHLNELPYYYEGVQAALIPTNFQKSTKNKPSKGFKLTETPLSSFEHNLRQESAKIKIVLDSQLVRLTTKETLSGQFSTILRPLYLNECIDSAIAPHYFKKCIDKPNGVAKKIKPSSSMNYFPYRYVFDCTEKLNGADTNGLSLKAWFSFVLSKEIMPSVPNYDYYFDFVLTDTYTFDLDFGRPVVIKNKNDFEKNINNDYFSLLSDIKENGKNGFIMNVSFSIKKESIPKTQAHLLTEIIERLDNLNNFTLKLARN